MTERTYNDQGHVRVKVEQAAGTEVLPGLVAADPDVARPHFEKFGWCDERAVTSEGWENPKIVLDDGTVLWGYECWWSYA
jgi:hypothetical protein